MKKVRKEKGIKEGNLTRRIVIMKTVMEEEGKEGKLTTDVISEDNH